tara:strand:- start:865 stop:1029 length:165 start_codon:yes stop_codon:yes gene_type:complete
VKDLVEQMKENKKLYYGVSRKLVSSSSYQLYRLGEKTVMPTFINIRRDKESDKG